MGLLKNHIFVDGAKAAGPKLGKFWSYAKVSVFCRQLRSFQLPVSPFFNKAVTDLLSGMP